jgi:glycosyltransferase involved in cell wall biosynthesis
LVALNPSATFLPFFDETDCLKFAPFYRIWPKKFDGLVRFLLYGSVYYPSRQNTELLADFLTEKRVRVLLAEYGMVGCAVARACQKAKVDLFVHFHGFDASRLLRVRHVRSSYRRLSHIAKGFIFPSQFLADRMRSIGVEGKKLHVAPCCVNVDDFQFRARKDDCLLLSVGRFVAKKAPHKTLRCFAKVLRNYPRLRLEMIGDGNLLQTCKDLAKSLKIDDRVVFHGSKSHGFVKRKMAEAQLFLQHSVTAANGDTEGLGVSLLEAMASGAVVIATRHNGFVETVVDGETGFLVDEHDVEAMANCCLRLLADKDLLDLMRQKARERVENYFTVDQQMVKLRHIMGISDACL